MFVLCSVTLRAVLSCYAPGPLLVASIIFIYTWPHQSTYILMAFSQLTSQPADDYYKLGTDDLQVCYTNWDK